VHRIVDYLHSISDIDHTSWRLIVQVDITTILLAAIAYHQFSLALANVTGSFFFLLAVFTKFSFYITGYQSDDRDIEQPENFEEDVFLVIFVDLKDIFFKVFWLFYIAIVALFDLLVGQRWIVLVHLVIVLLVIVILKTCRVVLVC
jgi:Ca2+/Na+ antiporter